MEGYLTLTKFSKQLHELRAVEGETLKQVKDRVYTWHNRKQLPTEKVFGVWVTKAKPEDYIDGLPEGVANIE